jgi:hypothetical protein
MIDTVELVFGHTEPLWLDVDSIVAELGSDDGQVKRLRFGDREKEYGMWKVGHVLLMLGRQSGRLELRASIPKLLTGRNDETLDVAGVHEGLHELVRRGGDLVGKKLTLKEARPRRIDYVNQWDDVESVRAVLAQIRASFNPPRKPVTEWSASSGALGHSLVYGYGTRHALRFYDKGAESAEQQLVEVTHGLTPEELEALSPAARELKLKEARREAREQVLTDANLDTVLRYEVQDKRPNVVREIHANGYNAAAVEEQLRRPLEAIPEMRVSGFADVLAQEPDWPHRFAYAVAKHALAEHPEHYWPVARKNLHRNTYSRWRRRARGAARRTWEPTIPEGAFGSADLTAWDAEEAA